MNKGTVKFFNDSKGFGFITEEGSNKDHFVHISGLIDEVREGDEVEFELKDIHLTFLEHKPVSIDGLFLLFFFRLDTVEISYALYKISQY